MSLRFAILVSLESGAQTGYEIAREFDTGVGHFWHATHQQIYRELGKLADEALVEFEEIQQESRPSKKRYLITEKGHAELANWLNSPTAHQPLRDPLLVKISAGFLADREQLKTEVLDQRTYYLERLERYKGYEEEFQTCRAKASDKQTYLYLTLRRGILASEAWVTWADETLAFLQEAD